MNEKEYLETDDVAKMLRLSDKTIYKKVQASLFMQKVKRGEKRPEEAPKSYRCYLNDNFPIPVPFGGKIRRFKAEEVQNWLQEREEARYRHAA